MYDFLDFNEDEVLDKALAKFEEITGEELYAGDERSIMIHTFLYIATMIAQKCNYNIGNMFVDTVDETFIDTLGNHLLVNRLPASPAHVNMKFTISGAPEDIIIPQGTRVTADGIVFFATTEDRIISMESGVETIPCKSLQDGAVCNNYGVGQINVLTDVIPYVVEVSNVSAPVGGKDIEDTQSYRARLKLRNSTFSTAGPKTAYVYYAMSADACIASVSVVTTEEATVNVVILCEGGSIPTDETISKVQQILDNSNIRPVTDKVVVNAPNQVHYNVDVSYTLPKDIEDIESVKTCVEQAVSNYIAWQSEELGRSINPNILLKEMLNAGAYSVNITQPDNIILNEVDVAVLDRKTVIYDGIQL